MKISVAHGTEHLGRGTKCLNDVMLIGTAENTDPNFLEIDDHMVMSICNFD